MGAPEPSRSTGTRAEGPETHVGITSVLRRYRVGAGVDERLTPGGRGGRDCAACRGQRAGVGEPGSENRGQGVGVGRPESGTRGTGWRGSAVTSPSATRRTRSKDPGTPGSWVAQIRVRPSVARSDRDGASRDDQDGADCFLIGLY